MNDLDQMLGAITPLDGRYRAKLTGLEKFCGEGALISYRIRVEAHWLLHLSEEKGVGLKLSPPVKSALKKLSESGGVDLAAQKIVKKYESTTNHDVKAVEYYLRDCLRDAGAGDDVLAFIHFACTSEDINNLSYAMMLDELCNDHLLPIMDKIIKDLSDKAGLWSGVSMLSRTHGQTATPTTVGKEFAVFGHRLKRQREYISSISQYGKMNGAVGNYNAHIVAYPEVDWEASSKAFVEKLALTQNPLTTQIENHDTVIELLDSLRRFNIVLVGFCRDIWSYISLGYFGQKLKEGEVGSSTMPHKVNPIDFENAEGNLGIASSLSAHMCDKLLISRWQRDLSDSTVLRSLATVFGHSELAYHSLLKGLGKIKLSEKTISKDIDEAWEVLAEPIQTVMRKYGVVDAYERLKSATRGQAVTKKALHELVNSCGELPDGEKKKLTELLPSAYTGKAEALAKAFTKTVK